MRLLFAILLSCTLSLNFFFYSDDIYGYSREAVNQKTVTGTYIDSLKQLGYYRSEFRDEKLNFRIAVLRFQSDSNIEADGFVGKDFRSALLYRLENGNELIFNDYVKNPASSRLWLTVNKTNRILTVYMGKAAIKKYPVALGREDFITPEGKFVIKNKVINPEWSGGKVGKPEVGGSKTNPLGYRWLGLSIGSKNLYGIHGNSNPYSIGQDVSRGCIRMFNSDVEHLFTYIPHGAPVWIGTDKQLRKWGVYQESNIK